MSFGNKEAGVGLRVARFGSLWWGSNCPALQYSELLKLAPISFWKPMDEEINLWCLRIPRMKVWTLEEDVWVTLLT